ncbi:DUF2508 domain-containing protein [Hathewaya histolytica]|uniref:Protein of uncharacterized function (DUF2508) n=1 Tax=Hathewaya histolytica TaxID=1498 RepID=A0A4U9QW58_HATHI|nr:DUF2508 family protein [Hathewaya histolytica]VTQ81703.1 Protein of uncharacterised function (DUF2508) [Hathewaya histolytica]
MDKKDVLDVLFEKVKYSNEQMDIIYSLEEAREEWHSASRFFQYVSEPDLVDYAIHREDAAKSKFMYYLSKARDKGIEVNWVYMIG